MSDWEFELDDVGPEAESEGDALEPGSPGLENSAFFVLGIALALYLIVTLL